MIVTGYYNESGYWVETDNPADAIYQAGNHALESTQDGTGTGYQLSLGVIKEFCIATTKEIAEDVDADYGGVEYLEPE